jgi:parvulin-like peptidyl-prolyl isomerase
MTIAFRKESMSAVLQLGDLTLTAEQVLSHITKYRLVPQLAREIVIEDAIKNYLITDTEHLAACKKFYQQHQLHTELELEQWLRRQQLDRADLTNLINRELGLTKFKTTKWGSQVESYFCQRKSQIDQAVFSMIRVKDSDIAEEIYFRLIAKESSFADLAPLYSQGMEAKTKGISGPVELGKIDPVLANLLATSQPAEVLPPKKIGDWWVVIQLETIIEVPLDEGTRQRLIEELFTVWVNEEVQKLLSQVLEPVTPLRPTLPTTA